MNSSAGRQGDEAKTTMMDSLFQDLRYAARRLARTPGFTAAAVLTLAVGIGATTAVFSVIDAVILRPLTYQDPDRLYAIHEVLPQTKTPVVAVNAMHFREWRSRARSFEEMALLFGLDVNLTGVGEPERIHAARVSPSLFPMLGVHAQLGRTFLEEEDQPGRDLIVVLSDDLWRSRFARDPQIVGRTIALDGEPHTIIGVLSADFALPKLRYLSERPSVAERPQLWKPFALWNNESILAQMFAFACIARIKTGVSRSQALAELNAIQANLAHRAPQKSQFQAALIPLQDQIIGRSRSGVQLMLAAVVMVLVTGCVNIAHLLFARGNARRREMAIRQATGATKSRLVRQMLVENLLVSTMGGLLGIVAAYNAVRLIRTSASVDVPRLDDAALNSRVLLFTLATVTTFVAVSLLVGVVALVASFIPARRATRVNPIVALRYE